MYFNLTVFNMDVIIYKNKYPKYEKHKKRSKRLANTRR